MDAVFVKPASSRYLHAMAGVAPDTRYLPWHCSPPPLEGAFRHAVPGGWERIGWFNVSRQRLLGAEYPCRPKLPWYAILRWRAAIDSGPCAESAQSERASSTKGPFFSSLYIVQCTAVELCCATGRF